MRLLDFGHSKRTHQIRRRYFHGQTSLRAYLVTGNPLFLRAAESDFRASAESGNLNAKLLLAITQTHLGKTDKSIAELRALDAEKVNFNGEVDLQLAFAMIRDKGPSSAELLKAAEDQLSALVIRAEGKRQHPLLLRAKALQALLYRTLADSGEDDKRSEYENRAVKIAEEVLKGPDTYTDKVTDAAARFDTLTTLGDIYQDRGQRDEAANSPQRQENWTKAEEYYNRALAIYCNSLRLLNRLGWLRLQQADAVARIDVRSQFRADARNLLLRSVATNGHDDWPHYWLAEIAIKEGTKKEAQHHMEMGRSISEGISKEEWDDLLSRIEAMPMGGQQTVAT